MSLGFESSAFRMTNKNQKPLKSSQISRKQLITIIAKLRGTLYSVQGQISPSSIDCQADIDAGLAVSSFDVSETDLDDGRFASLPTALEEAGREALALSFNKK